MFFFRRIDYFTSVQICFLEGSSVPGEVYYILSLEYFLSDPKRFLGEISVSLVVSFNLTIDNFPLDSKRFLGREWCLMSKVFHSKARLFLIVSEVIFWMIVVSFV